MNVERDSGIKTKNLKQPSTVSIQYTKMIKTTILAFLALVLISVNGFVTPSNNQRTNNIINKPSSSPLAPVTTSSTTLFERQWNFNEGRGPFGLKKNAEIWNGRVAQMGFTIVLLQELVTGKGVIQSVQDGDAFAYIMLGATALSVVGLSGFLALKGKDKFITTE